jgi:hypothetical protein
MSEYGNKVYYYHVRIVTNDKEEKVLRRYPNQTMGDIVKMKRKLAPGERIRYNLVGTCKEVIK